MYQYKTRGDCVKVKEILEITKGELIIGILEDESNKFSRDTRTIKLGDTYIFKFCYIAEFKKIAPITVTTVRKCCAINQAHCDSAVSLCR